MSGLVPWVVLFLLSLGGGGVVLAPVAVLTRDARPAFALAWWRAALLALVALPTAEVSGLTRWAREALPSMRSPRTVVTTRTTPALAPADGLPEPVRWPALLGGAGTLALAGRWLVGKALLLRMRRRLHPLASAELAVRIDRVARQLKCPMPAVGQSSALEGPLVFAAWGSVLALPADFESSYSPAQQEAILAHELGHLAQRDPLWHDLTEGLTALVWWNPLVWWARSRLAQASESAADEATLALEDGPVLLAESLLALAHRLTARQANGAFGVTGGLRSRLATRVRRLLELRPANSPQEAGRRGRFVAAASIFAVVLGVCFVTAWCRPAGAHASLWPMIRPVTPARPPARAGADSPTRRPSPAWA